MDCVLQWKKQEGELGQCSETPQSGQSVCPLSQHSQSIRPSPQYKQCFCPLCPGKTGLFVVSVPSHGGSSLMLAPPSLVEEFYTTSKSKPQLTEYLKNQKLLDKRNIS